MLGELDSSVFPILSLNKLAWLLHVRKEEITKVADTAGRFYKPFDILETRRGKEKRRHIDYPTGKLYDLQKSINAVILRKLIPSLPGGLIGGVAGKSIIDNASPHTGKEMVVTIDLRDCFPNTNNKKVYEIWATTLGCGRGVARVLTQLTTFQTRTPQGAPTSLMLCNLSLLPIYAQVTLISQEKGLNFTLYVDDITISGKASPTLDSIKEVLAIVQRYGRAVRHDKIVIMPSNIRQEVTGTVVNKKVAAHLEKVRNVREEIFKLSKKGEASVYEVRSLRGRIQHVKNLSPSRGHSLEGLVEVLLPDLLIYEGVKAKEEWVDCKSTRKHRNYKNQTTNALLTELKG